MAGNLRVVPQVMPPVPQQQDWVWDGTNWCSPCNPAPMPPPCPPSGWPTPCPPWFPPPAGQAPWYPGANGGVSFSATPPANPIRGNFWWDGTMLHLFDGAAWVNIGPGASGGGGGAFVGTTPPSNPAVGALWWNGTVLAVWDGTKWAAAQSTTEVFAITSPTVLALPAASAWGQVAFTATPTIDIQNGWNAATRQYMPQVAGNYAFFIRGYFVTGAPGTAGIALLKNDPGSVTSTNADITIAIASQYDSAQISGWQTAGGIVPMNGTTDYVRMYAKAVAGGFQSAAANPVFVGWKLP